MFRRQALACHGFLLARECERILLYPSRCRLYTYCRLLILQGSFTPLLDHAYSRRYCWLTLKVLSVQSEYYLAGFSEYFRGSFIEHWFLLAAGNCAIFCDGGLSNESFIHIIYITIVRAVHGWIYIFASQHGRLVLRRLTLVSSLRRHLFKLNLNFIQHGSDIYRFEKADIFGPEGVDQRLL